MSITATGGGASTAMQQAVASLQVSNQMNQGAAKLLQQGTENKGQDGDNLLSAAANAQSPGLDISV